MKLIKVPDFVLELIVPSRNIKIDKIELKIKLLNKKRIELLFFQDSTCFKSKIMGHKEFGNSIFYSWFHNRDTNLMRLVANGN